MAAPHFTPESLPQDTEYDSQLSLARMLRASLGRHENPLLLQETHTAHVNHARVPYRVRSILPIGSTATKLVVPGFNGTQNAYADLAEALAYDGYTAVTFRPSRAAHDLLRPQNLLAEEAVAIMEDIYDRYGIDEFDEEAHSMGGPAGVKGAEILNTRPRGPRVRKLGLVAAAGVTHHNIVSLGMHVPEVWWEARHILRHHPQLVAEGLLHFYTNLPRTLGEMMEVSHCRLPAERLQNLGELGVSTTAQYLERDPFFPAHKALAELDGAVDEFKVGTVGGHLAPITHYLSVAHDIGEIDQALLSQAA